MSFDILGLSPGILRAIAERGYSTPTPIQAQAIPPILAGRDVLAGAQTGTGKTAGFTLPILQRLHDSPRKSKAPRALILVPTRELAAQVHESVRSYGKHLRLRSCPIFGGVSINPQVETLMRGIDILVATPGRLLDHAEQGTVELDEVEILVLDEADRMLDMGFIHDIKRIMKILPKQRQNLMFSATYSEDIRRLAQGLLRDPAAIEVARSGTAAQAIEQVAYFTEKNQKRALLSHLIRGSNWPQVLVFTCTKHAANRLAKQLEEDGITTGVIHGNKSQNARTAALAAFKQARIRALVATEVAARGLDIEELPYVVNYELPNVPEAYVHRIGRTGRAGASGVAISLVAPDEAGHLKNIERAIRKTIQRLPLPEISAAPIQPKPKSPLRSAQGQQPKKKPSHSNGAAARHQANRNSRPSSRRRRGSAQQRFAHR